MPQTLAGKLARRQEPPWRQAVDETGSTGCLAAELLEGGGVLRTVAQTPFDNPRTKAAVLATVAAFGAAVSDYMERSELAS